MEASKLQTLVVILASFGAYCASAAAQTVDVPEAKISVRDGNLKPAYGAIPFALEDKDGPEKPIEYRSVAQMSERDRLQAANSESAIGERASYSGLEFNQGAWSYQQVVCPAFPQHIFLRFLRNNGSGDVSLFTASIPRGDEGRVRIIPIQMRSYSLFSPAPINSVTLSAFNHIRAEENPEKAPEPDWLGVGLCYAALAGGRPQLAVPSAEPQTEKYPVSSTAELKIRQNGSVQMAFSDTGEGEKPVQWRMEFARNGSLLKASKVPAPLYKGYWYLHPAAADVKGRPVQAGKVKAIRYAPQASAGVPFPASGTSPVGTPVPATPPPAQ